MDGLYQPDVLDELKAGAESLLPQWGLTPATRLTLLSVSENATYRADDPEREAPVILRVHRPHYHSRAEIDSELMWIDALRESGTVATPAPLATLDGRRIAAFDHRGEPRHVAAFAFMRGREPVPTAALVDGFELLGQVSARLHAHARRWQPPAGFVRKHWTWETTLGPRPHWGPWQAAAGLDAAGIALIERASADIRARLDAYGRGADRYGLIHADLRLAAAGTFLDHEPFVRDLQDAWFRGYRRVAPVTAADEAMMPVFVMLRRILLTAWGASHAETPSGASMGAAYTAGTLEMAERYLSTGDPLR
jgi:Ser/Thr protein kinase RdoA (MazF antagonist)